ncbi:hypothetical protein [Acidisphaera sp. L21]|uniref:hypothetical protein n=1 Tax=Acidisphaera sp. L21 TaxID=1641851 RepID=UPI00131CC6E1|nr:hypothetical protein [Acidisphaera sp. L21]
MPTIVFVTVETEPLARFDLGEAAVVADLLRVLEGRGIDVAELLVFKEDHREPLERHHPLHGHDRPVFHAHRAREIEVEVHYNAATFHHRFPPSATVATVTRWAVEEARLGPEEAGEHVLQVSGTRDKPSLDKHLGSLAHGGRKASFDLVRKQLVQG